MNTNLTVNNDLLERARSAGKHRTPKAAVTAALKEYIDRRTRQESNRRRKQLRILDMVGKVEYFEDYDYKALRRKETIARNH
jgi:hypothetical protein